MLILMELLEDGFLISSSPQKYTSFVNIKLPTTLEPKGRFFITSIKKPAVSDRLIIKEFVEN